MELKNKMYRLNFVFLLISIMKFKKKDKNHFKFIFV